METRGVPVVAYGSDIVLAFWWCKSPYAAPLRLDTAEKIARLYDTSATLGLFGSMLVVNTVLESDEIQTEKMAGYTEAAQKAAEAQNISGKPATSFLLAKIQVKPASRPTSRWWKTMRASRQRSRFR